MGSGFFSFFAVAHLGQVEHVRLNVEFFQQVITASFRIPEFIDTAVLVVVIAEDDRVGRARLRAGGVDVAVLDRYTGFLVTLAPYSIFSYPCR